MSFAPGPFDFTLIPPVSKENESVEGEQPPMMPVKTKSERIKEFLMDFLCENAALIGFIVFFLMCGFLSKLIYSPVQMTYKEMGDIELGLFNLIRYICEVICPFIGCIQLAFLIGLFVEKSIKEIRK